MKKTIKEIEHEYTDELVCPYCGYEKTDSWEYHEDEGGVDCDECDKSYLYTRVVTVEYITDKCDCINGDGPHSWRKVSGVAWLYYCPKCNTHKLFRGETRRTFKTVEKI